MKRLIPFVTLFVIAILTTLLIAQPAVDKKPRQNGVLVIDGKEHPFVVGVEQAITLDGKPHRVTVKLDPFHSFSEAGLTFRYPRSMYYALDDSDPNVTIWSMDGDSAIIMVQRYDTQVGEQALVDALVSQYHSMKADVKVLKTKWETKGGTYDGKMLMIQMGDIKLLQKVFYHEDKDGATSWILQDSLDHAGRTSDEFRQMLEVLSESFKVQQ